MRKVSVLGLAVLAAAFFAVSCGSTRQLAEGEYKLSRNRVEFAGESGLKTGDVSPYIKQQPAAFSLKPELVVYDPDLVDASVENIKNHLDYIGWYNSGVESEVSVKKRKVTVTYRITPGDRYTLSTVSYDLPPGDAFAADFYADTLRSPLRRGMLLSEAALAAESERYAAYLRTKGYFDATKALFHYVADTLSHDGTAALEVLVSDKTPMHKYRIGSVDISFPKDLKIREKVLRSLNMVRPGAVYSETDINKTYTRFSAMRLFNSVGIEMTPAGEDLVDCMINLSRAELQGYKLNMEMSTNSTGLIGISPQFNYFHKNVFRGGEWLNLGFTGNFQFRLSDHTRSNEIGVSAGLSLPRFLGFRTSQLRGANIPRTEFNISYNYQNRPEYTRDLFSASYGYSGMTRGRLTYQFYPLQVNLVDLYNIDPDFEKNTLIRNPYIEYSYQDHLDAGIGGMVYYSTSPDINPKTSYSYIRLSLDLSGNVLSLLTKSPFILGVPFAQYARTELTLGRTWRLGKNDTRAVAARLVAGVGYAYGNSSVLPYEKKFFVGGANSMRGWQSRTLGPGGEPQGEGFIIPSQVGDVRLEADLEYRFPLVWKLEGALFAEVGNVWDLKYTGDWGGFSLASLAADWGVGLRADLGIIVVRVDAGVKLRDPAHTEERGYTPAWIGPAEWFNLDTYALHFGVGYPF
ncbi:MAG: BamA/TamA family outer membrane protein [Bacteroidales bacterium]|nr:BamA/TamA family outer membrane protein [Bacteroidales bacterium]